MSGFSSLTWGRISLLNAMYDVSGFFGAFASCAERPKRLTTN
jgi:hypothetical protein